MARRRRPLDVGRVRHGKPRHAGRLRQPYRRAIQLRRQCASADRQHADRHDALLSLRGAGRRRQRELERRAEPDDPAALRRRGGAQAGRNHAGGDGALRRRGVQPEAALRHAGQPDFVRAVHPPGRRQLQGDPHRREQRRRAGAVVQARLGGRGGPGLRERGAAVRGARGPGGHHIGDQPGNRQHRDEHELHPPRRDARAGDAWLNALRGAGALAPGGQQRRVRRHGGERGRLGPGVLQLQPAAGRRYAACGRHLRDPARRRARRGHEPRARSLHIHRGRRRCPGERAVALMDGAARGHRPARHRRRPHGSERAPRRPGAGRQPCGKRHPQRL
jgi:hypothetical protein